MKAIEKTIGYKFLNLKNGKIKSEHGNKTWIIGKNYTCKGKIKPCSNGFHASLLSIDALSYVKGDVFAIVEASGLIKENDKFASSNMRILKAWKWTPNDSIALAIYSAELVIKYFEDKYPDDKRPRKAIQAARKYLKNPTLKNKNAADAAAHAAHAAAHAAHAAAYAAAHAAYAAALLKVKTQIHQWIFKHTKDMEVIGVSDDYKS